MTSRQAWRGIVVEISQDHSAWSTRGRSWQEVSLAQASRRRRWHARVEGLTCHSSCSCATVNDRGDDRREEADEGLKGTVPVRHCSGQTEPADPDWDRRVDSAAAVQRKERNAAG